MVDTEPSKKTGGDKRRGSDAKEKVVLDTNAFMMPGQFGVDVFDEVERMVGGYEPVVLDVVASELEEEAEEDEDARLGLRMMNEKCSLVETNFVSSENDSSTHADDVIVAVADREDWKVVTNDAGLRDRLLEVGVPVLYLRQRSYLDIRYP